MPIIPSITPKNEKEEAVTDIPPSDNVQSAQAVTPNGESRELADLKQKAHIKELENTTSLKSDIACHAKDLSVISIMIWGIVILIQMLSNLLDKPAFNDNIFIAITTGCTVNILAVLLAVTKGLFK